MNVWTEHVAPDGRQYYYNALTGQSTWTKPAEMMMPMTLPPMPVLPPQRDCCRHDRYCRRRC